MALSADKQNTGTALCSSRLISMDKLIIEQIINQSIKRLKDEYELLGTTMLNALHHNIDILITNAEKWFGASIPDDYRGVLNSLMTITYLYYQEKGDVSSMSAEPQYEEFQPDAFINGIIRDIESIMMLKNISVELESGDVTIRTSRKILRDSLYNIFLSISQFMAEESSSSIGLKYEPTRILITLSFDNLSDYLPDPGKLSRVFYSYYDGKEYHLNVGINVALENLRNIGVMVKIESNPASNSLKFSISIPTTHFLDTIDDIRRVNMPTHESPRGVNVGLRFEDIIIEMVIRETLLENGYTAQKVSLSAQGNAKQTWKTLVTDSESLIRSSITAGEILTLFPDMERLIIILGDNDPLILPESDRIISIEKPFDVDTVISHIL